MLDKLKSMLKSDHAENFRAEFEALEISELGADIDLSRLEDGRYSSAPLEEKWQQWVKAEVQAATQW
ncbi:hypothetical protein ACQR3P_30470 [Rhodococcus sp. IEGM1300]